MRNINNISVAFKVKHRSNGTPYFEIDYNDFQCLETSEELTESARNEIALYCYDDVIMTTLPSEMYFMITESAIRTFTAANGNFTIGEILDIVCQTENEYLLALNITNIEDHYFNGLEYRGQSTFVAILE